MTTISFREGLKELITPLQRSGPLADPFRFRLIHRDRALRALPAPFIRLRTTTNSLSARQVFLHLTLLRSERHTSICRI